jgi:hypothetical protein
MTEDDAKTKWCPFARVQFVAQGPANRVDPHYLTYAQGPDREYVERQVENTKCLGSACSAWRWRVQKAESPETRQGFCGLSGPGNTT